ncbi:hypothetical protein HDU83_005354 [Entophlyctis luteolus]|nr:hypothetical protein HDU82_004152 [Entophlyctis luteolus]KAJ3354429.1 hypothetical protein HDU83_005354 [Entophlyctis luteolus]
METRSTSPASGKPPPPLPIPIRLPETDRVHPLLAPPVLDLPDEPQHESSFDLEGFYHELENLRSHMANSNLTYGKTAGLKAARSNQDLTSSSTSPPAMSAEVSVQPRRLQAHSEYLSMQGQRQWSANASLTGSAWSENPETSSVNTSLSASPSLYGHNLKSKRSSFQPSMGGIPSSSIQSAPQMINTPLSASRTPATTTTKSDSPTFTYPSTSATLLILLTNDGQHGSLHRSRPLPTTPNVATSVPPEILAKKQPGGIITSLFKNSTNTPLSPPGLVNCVVVLVKRRLYVFDVKKNGLRRGRVAGPLMNEALFSASAPTSSAVPQGSPGSQRPFPLTPLAGFRRDSNMGDLPSPTSPTDSGSNASRSSSSFYTSTTPSTLYSPEMLTQKPFMVLILMNACVAEDGVWILRLSGFDKIRNGSYNDVYLQLADCDEMLRWLRVLRAATQ